MGEERGEAGVSETEAGEEMGAYHEAGMQLTHHRETGAAERGGSAGTRTATADLRESHGNNTPRQAATSPLYNNTYNYRRFSLLF